MASPRRKTLRTAGIVAAIVGVGVAVFYARREPAGRGTMPPPPPRPGQTIPDITYTAGGESQLTLPVGSEFRVVWDPSVPWTYSVQDTEAVQVVSTGDGFARFRAAIQLPSGAVSQVFVIATDEQNNVLSEHKVTVFGP